MAKLYGLGASVVIIGALFKIQHYPGAGIMLIIGLSTEALIFAFSAFEPIHEEVDWSLVYPELAGMHDEEGEEHKKIADSKADELTVTEQLDNMLEEAKIGPELIQSLGDGLRSLGDQASKLNNITDASVATNEYVSKVKSAAKNVGELSESYSRAAESLTNLTVSNSDGQTYGEQLQKVSKNLSALNAVYELQLQSSNDHMKATGKFYDGVTDLIKNLNESVNDTKKYKEEIAQLAENLGTLNTVYGNMLTAMNFKR
ncbi:MAG: gliding motility protein GldL [Bacteroidia bacterium]